MNYNNILNQYTRLNNISVEQLIELKDFSNYEHQDFSEAADALKFIEVLSQNKTTRRVVVDTDYDCDGVMSGIILEASLKRFGFNVSTHHPSEHDGYGLTIEEAERILQKFPDVSLIVTADSGINCKPAIDYLYEKDVRVLVSDHHEGKIEEFPDKALVCVDVNRIDKNDDYKFKHISGAQTAYKLMHLYAEKYGSRSDLTYIESLRLFAAISVISDVMQIDNENRELVKELLEICNSSRLEKMALTNEYVARLREFLQKFGSGEITQETFGFAVVPTINSNRRMLGESNIAFQVFDRDAFLREKSINSLMRLNDLRKSTKKLAQSQAKLVVDEKYLKIAVVEADQGILGLIASDCANRNSCASLVFRKAGDRMTASGRGHSRYAISELTKTMTKDYPEINCSFGGHSHALGGSVAVEDFERFCEVAAKISNEIYDDSMKSVDRAIEISLDKFLNDSAVLRDIKELCTIIRLLQPLPYYIDNLKFKIRAKKVEFIANGFESFGKSKEHIKMQRSPFDIIGFFDFETFYQADFDDEFEMIFDVKTEGSVIKCIISKIMTTSRLHEDVDML